MTLSSLSLPLHVIVLIVLVLLLTGLVKGAIGIGLAVIPVSMLSGFVDPRFVLALMVAPAVATNLWQSTHAGAGLRISLLRFWPLILAYMVGTWGGAQLMVSVDTAVLIGILGAVVVAFSIFSYVQPQLRIPRRHESWLGSVAGAAGGIMNGLTTVNGPPLVMYLVALGLQRDSFVGAYGVIALCGAVPLAVSYAAVGVLGPQEAVASVLALIPIFAGLALGEALRRFIDPVFFRRILLAALIVLGLNLIRRAVM